MPQVQGQRLSTQGLNLPIIALNPASFINCRVAPGTNQHAEQSTLWIQPKNTAGAFVGAAYINVGNLNGAAQWAQIATSGGSGVFSSLIVNGTSTLNGNVAVTGSITATTTITAGTGLTALTGNITAGTGNVILSTAAAYIQLPGPVRIMSGAGAPANGLAVNVGDMYINTTAASAVTRLYIATAANTWTNVTCAA